MDELKAQAMLQELQQQVIILSSRCANLAAEFVAANQRIQTLTEQVEKQAEEHAELKKKKPKAKTAAPLLQE